MSYRIHPFCSDVILMRLVSSSSKPWSRAFVGINNTSVFCRAFPNIAVGFSTALDRSFLQGIAVRFGASNFLRAAFIASLNSSSFGSIKNIPLNCLALSSFGFSIVHLCFAFCFAASDICFHISGHTLSGREVVCFLVRLHPDHVYPPSGLSFNKMNLEKPDHASDNSLFPSTFQWTSIFSPAIHPVMYMLFW